MGREICCEERDQLTTEHTEGCHVTLEAKGEVLVMDKTREVAHQKPPRLITRTRCYSEGTDISSLKDHLVSPTLFKEKEVESPNSSGNDICLSSGQ